MLRWLEQVGSITAYSLRTLPQRAGSVVASAVGIAGVVAVFIGVLSIAAGFRAAMTQGADDDTVIVLRSGSTGELVSAMQRADTRVVGEAPGVLRDGSGALSSPELFLILNLPRRSTNTDANVPLRGVEEEAFRVHDKLRIVEGRAFEWGRSELIVGLGASREFGGLDLGGALDVAGQPWTVVGLFEAGGGLEESEVWADARLLQSVYRRGDTFQSVYTKLESRDAFSSFKDELDTDPRVNVTVSRQSEFYASQSVLITGLITGLGTVVAALMGIGAVFGALNTMYTSVSSRTREIATLRALGFKSAPVIIAVLFESFVIAVLGGTIGGVVAWMAFDGFTASTINFQSFSQVAFAFDVTSSLLIQGVFYSTLIGLIGGLFPAIRAARVPIAVGLRDA